jgi:hypothetical protein
MRRFIPRPDFGGVTAVNRYDAVVAPPIGIYVEVNFPRTEARSGEPTLIRRPILPAPHPFPGIKHKNSSPGRIDGHVFERWRNYCHVAFHTR